MNPNVTMGSDEYHCQCDLIDYNKCTPLVGDVDSGGCACVGQGGMGTPVLSAQFCCAPKSALKNKRKIRQR